MRIDSAGNVGIGTTSPTQRLHLRSSAPAIEFDDSNFATVRGRIYSDEGNLLLEADYNNARNGSNIAFNVDATERMRITSAGNVGIGTSSPLAKLHVQNQVYVKGTGGGDGTIGIDINSGGSAVTTSAHTIRSGGGTGNSLIIETQTANSNGQILFQTNAAERMRIDSSGNLLVGTTTPGAMQASSQSVVVKAGVTGVVNARNDSVADNGTVDITVFSGGGGFAGLLVVQNILVATANSRTQTTFSVLGRGTDAEALQISTRNGSTGGSAFSVTFPSTGVIRITNTSGGTASITASFFGNQGF
jgi:hypothetical protein